MNTQEWTREAQNYTLATATRVNEEWLHSDIRSLETLKGLGKSIREIAVELNRSYYAVSSKLIELGLANTHKRSNSPKTQILICSVCFTTPSKAGVCFC
jgi:hypothetical protein